MENSTTYERFSSEGRSARKKRNKKQKEMKRLKSKQIDNSETSSKFLDYKKRPHDSSGISQIKTANTVTKTFLEENSDGRL